MEDIHTLSDEAVQVLIVGALNAEVPAANVVDSLVVNHERAVGVLQGGVSCEDGVVRLDNGGGNLRRRVDTELELALLAVVDGQTLHQEGTKTGTCSTTEGVEDEETLQTRAVVGDTADLVQDLVDELLADCVVTAGVVVGCILLAGDHVLGVEEGTVGTSANFIDNVGFQVGVDGARDVLALACSVSEVVRDLQYAGSRTSLGEESAEAMVVVLGLALLSEVAIGLDAVLKAVELSQCISMITPRRSRHPLLPPPFRIAGDGEVQMAYCSRINIPPSMSLRSGNRLGRLYAWSVSINVYHQDVPPKTGRSGRVRVVGVSYR